MSPDIQVGDVVMRRADVEALRDAIMAALPAWPWNNPAHDPLHGHPFEQVVRAALGVLTRRAEAWRTAFARYVLAKQTGAVRAEMAAFQVMLALHNGEEPEAPSG